MTFDEFKAAALRVMNVAFGGQHHVWKLKWDEGQDDGCPPHSCEFRQNNGVSTYDYSELTAFVVACHDEHLRGSVSSCNRELKLELFARNRTDERNQIVFGHPTIEDAIARIRKTQTAALKGAV